MVCVVYRLSLGRLQPEMAHFGEKLGHTFRTRLVGVKQTFKSHILHQGGLLL